ncbi:winged helix-turn-helix domain-containing protein [Roseovarius sp. 2305UL8-3]|uniref:winged helix-turn-helix domain-containing protein n=1 Tax=Roseovarius conchicola TaxID=3121636 RepID=UPI003527FE86
MVRLIAILGLACLASAMFFALWPDPWVKAEQKATLDAKRLAELVASPDRIGWRLSEDVTLLRAMIWDTEGALQYPPAGGLTPLAYEFSEDSIRKLTAVQSDVDTVEWLPFDLAIHELLYCRATPAVCMIYDRVILEEELELQPGDLLTRRNDRAIGLMFAMVACLFCGVGIWLKRKSDEETLNFKIIPERHIAMRGKLEVSLTPRDLKLLIILEDRAGAIVTKDELYDTGWGRDYMPNSRALDQHIINLRRKLDPDKSRPVLIETAHGVGYRLAK